MKLLIPIWIFLCFALIFQFLGPNIYDADGFYHFRHASIYRTDGLFNTSFPWAQYSVINKYSADIWYGFHLLLIPFTFLNDQVLGIKLAGVFLTTLSLLIYFFVLKKLTVHYPIVWTLFLGLTTPNMLDRIMATRPHFLTVALSVLLLYFISRDNIRGTFFTSAGIGFVHLALSWVAPLVAIVEICANLIIRQRPKLQKVAAVFGGLFVGWLLRPNPIGAIKISYIQIFQLALEKIRGVPLDFGIELYPIDWRDLFSQVLPLLILMVVAILLFIKSRRGQEIIPQNKRVFIYSSLFLSAIFFLLMIFMARRSSDFWTGFAVVFIAMVFTLYLQKVRPILIWSIVTICILISVNSVSHLPGYQERAFPPDGLRESALWLQEHSNMGDIVINPKWDSFGRLFFWNQKNYYLGGMDPIFQYAYDARLFWLNYFAANGNFILGSGKIYTCPRTICSSEELVDYVLSLKNEFKAKYIFIQKERNIKLKFALEKADGLKKVFETEGEAIFEVL